MVFISFSVIPFGSTEVVMIMSHMKMHNFSNLTDSAEAVAEAVELFLNY